MKPLLSLLFFAFFLSPLSLAESPTTDSTEQESKDNSISELKAEAEAGNPAAARQLYLRYTLNKQVKTASQWAEKYRELLTKQADEGDSASMLRLAANYFSGVDEFPRDKDLAIEYFSKASAAGEASAAYILGEIFKKDNNKDIAQQHYQRAYELYSALVEHNPQDALPLYWKGSMLLEGLGTEINQEEALKLLNQSAELHNEWAKTFLFKAYAEGKLLPKDEAKALAYAKQLADEHQDAVMAYTLACAYINGQGVEPNEELANSYLDQAVRANVGDAIALKASRLEAAGKLEEAIPYYQQAASMGQMEATTRLGIMLIKGEGMTQDTQEGLAYLTTAANRYGSPLACLELAHYYDSVDEPALADDWYIAASDLGVAQAMGRRGLQHLNPQSKLQWNPTLVYRWWKAGSEAGDPTCKLYLNLFYFAFIPLLLILCFFGPLLLIHKLNKRAEKAEKTAK